MTAPERPARPATGPASGPDAVTGTAVPASRGLTLAICCLSLFMVGPTSVRAAPPRLSPRSCWHIKLASPLLGNAHA